MIHAENYSRESHTHAHADIRAAARCNMSLLQLRLSATEQDVLKPTHAHNRRLDAAGQENTEGKPSQP